MKIINRKEAQLLGYNKYFTGEHCRNGHLAERYTASGTCSECINGKRKTEPKFNPETFRELAQQTYLTALTAYNDNLKRITDIYNKQVQLAQDYEVKAVEREKLDVHLLNQASGNFKLIEERSKLTSTWVDYRGHDRDTYEVYYLSLLQQRCGDFTMQDLRGRNVNKGGVLFKIKCYLEDKQHIADVNAGRVKPNQVTLQS